MIGSFSSGWVRWDAAPRFIGGEERSLEGGLRYWIETGSYADLRDQFLWVPFPPTTEDFAAAIGRAFEHWTLVDPETGLPGAVYFVEDLATPAVDAPGTRGLPGSFIGVNRRAEIDLFAESKLQNDEFAGRQFLYPVVVPEPSFGFLIGLGFLGLYGGTAYRRSRIRRSESSSK